jgi:AraC family transcriptional activator of mtrCDE
MLFPRGAAHRVRDLKRSVAAMPLTLGHDGMLPVRRNDAHEASDTSARAANDPAADADVDLLCGRFVYAPGSSALLLNALPDPLHVSLGDTQTLDALQTVIALMRGEAERRQAGALAIVTALSHALFAMALRVHGERNANSAGMLALLTDARLGASVQAMLDAPERAWTIAELGECAAMSRATYARHFNERAGVTVMDFLTQIRMAIASDLLLRTQRSAADIGEAVGYQSEAAFGKAFAQSVGMTPGRYRRRAQADDASDG